VSSYVAFLRGINVGGHGLVKMTDLKSAFEKTGFTKVRTVLASGNVIFETRRTNQKELVTDIESSLRTLSGKDIWVILRTLEHLQKLLQIGPFNSVKVTQSIRLYVSFLTASTKPRSITIPYSGPEKGVWIPLMTSLEVFSIIDLSRGKGTPDAMNILEKEFGPQITTRSWSTVLKILK
jgi:uncharacterized protein (DUF1697 family)